MTLMLISSTGGHFRTLIDLKPFWENKQRCWVTHKSGSTESVLEGEKVHWAFGPTNRSVKNLFKNLLFAWQVIVKEKPEIIVTTGAGVAVPFVIMGKLFGAQIVFIESITRVEELSLSAKLLLPWINRLYVRWPQLQAKYPKTELISV